MKNNIKWVIDKTLLRENTITKLTHAVEKSGAELELIGMAPFSEELLYNNIDEFKPIVYGPTTFVLLAYTHEYLSNGVFFDENLFLMSEYIKHWKLSVLNNDAIFIKAGELCNLNAENDQVFFVRPNEDTKALTGSLKNFRDLKMMVNGIINDNPYITQDTELVLCSPKEIGKEWRNIIIQGKVISSCRYRVNGKLDVNENDIPLEMIHFTETLYTIFTPHDVFVMDVCTYKGKYFVIECNCFNSSGFYNSDLSKIIIAVNTFVVTKQR